MGERDDSAWRNGVTIVCQFYSGTTRDGIAFLQTPPAAASDSCRQSYDATAPNQRPAR
ncbi:MAG: hypothetical protein ACTHMR_13930 [Thermomicrobiales bacterium]